MPVEWLNFQVACAADRGGAAALPEPVPALVARLRAADAGARWFFRADRGGDGVLDVWFEAAPPVLDELGGRVRAHGVERGGPVLAARRAARPPEPADCALGGALATLSSDLAADLRGGTLRPGDHLGLAALHLRLVTELLPGPERPAFLFLGWCQWSRAAGPAGRRAIAHQSAVTTAGLLELTVRTARDARWTGRWQHYAAGLRAAVDAHAADAAYPLTYLLFDHAHRSHLRLGLAAEAELLAARVLRLALLAQPAPDALAGTVLRHPATTAA